MCLPYDFLPLWLSPPMNVHMSHMEMMIHSGILSSILSFWLLPFEQHKFSFSKKIVLHNKFTRVTFTSLSQKGFILFGIALITMELSLVLHAFFVFHMCFPILVATCDTISQKGSIESSQFPSNFLFGTASSSYQVFLPLSHFSQN